ncbi:thermonuclease family protein [Rhizobium johnstonii]|nr:thermonuclease family protein [Rhizobium johnstonii]
MGTEHRLPKIMDPAGNLRQDIEHALRRPNLTNWQRTFLTDIHAQLERSRGQVRLSDKQWRKIFEILGRATCTSTVPSPPALRHPTTDQKRSRFRQQFRPRRRRLDRGLQRLAIGFLFVGVVAVGLQVAEYGRRGQFPQTPVTNAASDMPRFTVTDGDTVHVTGDDAGTRLVGFNTPEKFSPQCESERQLGERASLRLKELVSNGVARLTKVACACAPGTEGSEKCNHDRSCGTLRVDGEDVGNILIREGLAVPFVCTGTRCPPTPRPWCRG